MKRFLKILLSLAFSISLIGCSKQNKVNESFATTSDASIINKGNGVVWTIVKNVEDIDEELGWKDEGFDVPDQIVFNDTTFKDPQFSYYLSVAQAYYEFGAMSVYIRKAVGIYGGPITDRDIENNEFDYTWKQKIGQYSVNCYGNENGKAIVALWVAHNNTYCVTSQGLGGEDVGMPPETVEEIVKAVK